MPESPKGLPVSGKQKARSYRWWEPLTGGPEQTRTGDLAEPCYLTCHRRSARGTGIWQSGYLHQTVRVSAAEFC